MNNSGSGRVMLSGSADAPLQNLKIFGKSVQNGMPSPENPVPIVSLGRPVPGKNLCPYGTKTFSQAFIIGSDFGYFLPPGTYTFSANVTSTDEENDICQIVFTDTTKTDTTILAHGHIERGGAKDLVLR